MPAIVPESLAGATRTGGNGDCRGPLLNPRLAVLTCEHLGWYCSVGTAALKVVHASVQWGTLTSV